MVEWTNYEVHASWYCHCVVLKINKKYFSFSCFCLCHDKSRKWTRKHGKYHNLYSRISIPKANPIFLSSVGEIQVSEQKRKFQCLNIFITITITCILYFDKLLTVINVCLWLRNHHRHHRGQGLCEQIKPSQGALAWGLGSLLTKPKPKVMVLILTQFEFGKTNTLK